MLKRALLLCLLTACTPDLPTQEPLATSETPASSTTPEETPAESPPENAPSESSPSDETASEPETEPISSSEPILTEPDTNSLPTTSPSSTPSTSPTPDLPTSTDEAAIEDTSLKNQLVTILLSQDSGLKEKTEVSEITLTHAMQMAADTDDTEFKVQAEYNPLPPSPLVISILNKGVFPSDNLVNAFVTSGSAENLISSFTQQAQGVFGAIPFTHYGLSVVRKGELHIASLVLLTEIITLEGISPELESTGTRNINGNLVSTGFNNPSAIVTRPDGQIDEPDLKTNGNSFTVAYPFSEAGHYSFEINVDGSHGPQPAANFVVSVDTPALTPVPLDSEEAPEITDINAARQTLLNLVNQDRQSLGLSVLALDNTLSQAAQNHSEDMVNNQFVGHVSPTHGSPTDQAIREGITEPISQNIAVSRSLENSQQELMSSPGHRKTIINPDATHVGFGVERGDDGFLYITQDFLQRKIDLDTLPASTTQGTLNITGSVLEDNQFLAIFLDNNIVGDPIDLDEAGLDFNVPITLDSAGTHTIKVGLSDPPANGSFTFTFYNTWEISVSD